MPHRLDYEPTKELIASYRTTFSSHHGQEVLVHMMFDLGMFEKIDEGAEDIALKNYATRLVKILSGGGPTKENLQDFMMRLMKQPLPEEKKECA